MASQKEYTMLFQLSAKLDSAFSGAFKSAQSQVSSMQKDIDALNKKQSDINAYLKQQQAIERTTTKLQLLEKQHDNIQKEIAETENVSASLANSELSKQAQMDKTNLTLEQQQEKLAKLGQALEDAGISTEDLAGESEKLTAELEKTKQAQEKAAESSGMFSDKTVNAVETVQSALAAAGIYKLFEKIKDGLIECVEASAEYESAMTGVAKTTDMTDLELSEMAEEFKKLSTEIPLAATEIAEIAENAGQLGIAKENILAFTEVMANLGVATNLSATEAASQLAKFANITQMAASDYEALGSTVVALGNNLATTEADIVSMAMRLASAGTQAGMTEADIVSISAALSSLGLESQAGGSSFSKAISQMQIAVETGSDSLIDFANIAGYSVDEFSRLFAEDATSALIAFTQGLADTERLGESATVLLDEMGITELRLSDALKRAASSGDLFNESIQLGNQAWGENVALANEAALRYGTTESKLAMMQNSFTNLKIAVGDAFNPVLGEMYDKLNKVFSSVAQFVAENEALVQGITVAIGVFMLATAALTAYTVIAGVATAVSKAFAASTGLALGPVLLVVAGVAALVGGLVALSSAFMQESREVQALTAVKREQYYQLQELNAEYEVAQAQYGATSDEASALRYEIDELTAAYESGEQTLGQFIAKNDEIIASHDKIMSSYEESIASINNEEQGTLALIYALQGLASQTTLTASEQERMRLIMDKLNDSVPDLAITYDDATGSLNMSVDAMKKMVAAQAEQGRQAEKYQRWVDLKTDELALTDQLAVAEENLRKYREEMADNPAFMDFGLGKDLSTYEEAIEKLTEKYDENQAAIAMVTAEMEAYDAAMSEASGGNEAFVATAADIRKEMSELAEAYTEAYNAAYESINGQYDLWDKADTVTATSSSSIISNIEGQISYWQDYNSNLSDLNNRASEMGELGDVVTQMLASIADGSPEAVNAIAGMAGATDEELATMAQSWKTLQEEQKSVSDSLAVLVTDFDDKMGELEDRLAAAVEEMDMNEQAAVSGRNTIEGFISAANNSELLGRVSAAYAKVGQTAMNALNAKLDINSPSKETEWSGEMTGEGFILGIQNKQIETQKAMQQYGDDALAALRLASAPGATMETLDLEQMQVVAFAPQLMELLSARNYDTVSTEYGDSAGYGSPVKVVVNINVSGDADTETVNSLKRYGDDFAERVRDVMEEIESDRARGRYH